MTSDISLGQVLDDFPKYDVLKATEQIDSALRRRTGHIALFGETHEATTMVVNFVLSRAGGFECIPVSAQQTFPRITSSGLKGTLIAVVHDADGANSGQLEQLRLWAESRPVSLGRIRLLLIGGSTLEETLKQRASKALASRIDAHLWLRRHYLPSYAAPAASEPTVTKPATAFFSAKAVPTPMDAARAKIIESATIDARAAQDSEDIDEPSDLPSPFEAIRIENAKERPQAKRARRRSRWSTTKLIVAYAASICLGIKGGDLITSRPDLTAALDGAMASAREWAMLHGPESAADLATGVATVADLLHSTFSSHGFSQWQTAKYAPHVRGSGRSSATRVFVNGTAIETHGATLETLVMLEGIAKRRAAAVEAGSFTSQGEARALKNAIVADYPHATVRRVDSPQGAVYRVSIGESRDL